ncbi:MAG: hypothetical protein IJY50_00580 [Clostridia bacterium]|nr:hypothetical protein [Clostridia bacterium]
MNTSAEIARDNLTLWREASADNLELCCLQLTALGRQLHLSPTDILPEQLPLSPAELTREERMALCHGLLQNISLPTRISVHPPAIAACRVARLSGAIFDEAITHMASLLQGAPPLLLSSLSDILEEVADGSADFGLLPMEDAAGSRFLQFYEDFERLDLHIVCTCDIPSKENEGSLRFALISRLWSPRPKGDLQHVLEMRTTDEDGSVLSELLFAAGICKARLRRVDALPAAYPENSFAHFPVFLIPESEVPLLELYIRLFLPNVSIIGQYDHITT